MSTKHTPGPWEARSLYVRTLNGQVIARCHGTLGKFELEEPNARLIAAAPELLAALRAVVSVADRKTVEFDLAHAAIAKATGEQP